MEFMEILLFSLLFRGPIERTKHRKVERSVRCVGPGPTYIHEENRGTLGMGAP